MIPGVEGLHAWTPAGADEAAIVLGLKRDLETGEPIWPRFTITRIGGLLALGDPEDNREPRIGTLGERTRLSARRGKSVTYEGKIRAQSLREMREGRDALMEAFSDVAREGRMDASWHPDNPEFAGVPPVYFEARSLVCEVPEEQAGKRWDRSYVIGLRLADPRYFEVGTLVRTVDLATTETGFDF